MSNKCHAIDAQNSNVSYVTVDDVHFQNEES